MEILLYKKKSLHFFGGCATITMLAVAVCATVAQLVEQLIRNERVAGSSPVSSLGIPCFHKKTGYCCICILIVKKSVCGGSARYGAHGADGNSFRYYLFVGVILCLLGYVLFILLRNG